MPPQALFKFLQSARGLSVREMLESYNCGHRLEMVTDDKKVADDCVALSMEEGIPAQPIGETLLQNPGDKRIAIRTEGGWEYFD